MSFLAGKPMFELVVVSPGKMQKRQREGRQEIVTDFISFKVFPDFFCLPYLIPEVLPDLVVGPSLFLYVYSQYTHFPHFLLLAFLGSYFLSPYLLSLGFVRAYIFTTQNFPGASHLIQILRHVPPNLPVTLRYLFDLIFRSVFLNSSLFGLPALLPLPLH